MSLRKSFGIIALLAAPLLVAGCETGNMAMNKMGLDMNNVRVADYYGVPYCCDRTAPPGVALYKGRERTQRVAVYEEPRAEDVTWIEPAAGDEMFSESVRK